MSVISEPCVNGHHTRARAQVDARWLIELPRVRYEMPDGQIEVMPSHAIVTPKEGGHGG